jgi:PAS domain S-box-containing protein
MKSKLLELIDFEKVDNLLEGFNKTTGFVTAIIDLEGNILSKSGWRQLCTDFHREHPETSQKCKISDTDLANKKAKGLKYNSYKCLNGLVDVVVPLIINGEHIANLFTGQFFFEKPDRTFFIKQAEKYGFDKKKYLEAIDKVPVVSEEKVQTAMDFLVNMTQLISEMTFQKLEQTELNNELKESEFTFRKLFEESSDPILLLDGQNVFTECNQAALNLLKMTREQFLFLEPRNISPEFQPNGKKSKEAAIEMINLAYDKGLHRFDWTHIDSEGREFIVDISLMPIVIKGKKMLHTTWRDITERRQAEEENRVLADIIRKSGDFIGVADPAGKAFFVNPAGKAMVGLDEENEETRTVVEDYFFAEDLEIVKKEILPTVMEQGRWAGEFRFRHFKTGEPVYVYYDLFLTQDPSSGKVQNLSTVTRNITKRKKAEEELQKRNETFQNFVHALPMGMHLYQLHEDDTLVFAGANPAADKLLGVDNKQFIGKTIEQAFPPLQDTEVPDRYRRVARQGENWNTEQITFDNGIVKGAFEVHAFQMSPGKVGVLFSDITERKKAEAAVLESEEKMRSIYRVAPTGIGVVSNRVIKEVNPRICEITGYSREELLGKNARILYPSQEEYEFVGKEKYDQIRKKGTGKVETRWQKKDGSIIHVLLASTPIDLNDYPKGVTFTALDITDRKQAEETLFKSESVSKALLDGIPESAFLVDLDGTVIAANKTVAQRLNQKRDEMVGTTIFDTIPKEVAELRRSFFDKAVKTGKTVQFQDVRFDRIIDNRINPIFDQDGKISMLAIFGIDITERKKAEKELQIALVKYKVLFECFPLGITVADSNGNILETNPIAENLLGITQEEHVSRDIDSNQWQLVRPDESPMPPDEYASVRALKENRMVSNVEMGILRKDVACTWLNVNAAPLPLEGYGVVITYGDISERKKAEKALRQSEEKFRSLAENTSDVIATMDMHGKITYISRSIEDETGYTKEEIEGANIQKLLTPESHDIALDRLQKRLKGENINTPYEVEILTKTSQLIPFELNTSAITNESGKLTGIQIVARDITLRKQAEAALNESENRFRSLLEDIPSISVQGYNKNGTDIYWNEASEKLYGYTSKEAMGQNLLDLIIPSEMQENVASEIRNMSETGKAIPPSELSLMRKDGSRVTVFSSHTILIREGDNPELFCVDLDLTEIKFAEKLKQMQYNIARATIATRDLNELYDAIQNELNSLIDARNFMIAYYNEENRMLSSLLDKDERDQIEEWPAEKSITGYLIRQNRSMLLRKNEILHLYEEGIIDIYGTISEAWLGVPLKVEGKMLGAVVLQNYDSPDAYDQTSIEIMELIAHELSLFIDRERTEEKASKLSRAVEQSSVSVTITNKKGQIEYVNPFFRELTGYSFEEVKGKNSNILKSGHHSIQFYQELWDTILSGNDWEGEFLNKKKNGELYWAKAVITPVVHNDGIITNFIGIKQDITERKKMLEELLAAKEKAEESDKLKTAFINNISHEIRTPLNGILGFGDFMFDDEMSAEEKKEMLSIVKHSSKRLMNTVSDYMDMARIVSGTMEVYKKEFLLQSFFEDVVVETKQLCLNKQINFETDYQIDDTDLTLDSDPELITRILHTLLDNALKFTDKGSIRCGYKLKGGFIEFFVEDTGKGIAPAMLDAIFMIFTQENPANTRGHEGSGLGLSIASGLVKLLGGSISATSEKGVGSLFSFTIPHAVKELTEKEPLSGEKNTTITEKPLVLLAEDEESNYLYMEMVFKKAGFDYLLAKNGKEAVDYCQQHPEITLVLMDIKMPVMNGLEATRLIREFRPVLPIVATTAFAQMGDEQRFMAVGCDGYLAKPIRKETLFNLLKKYSS